MIPTSKHGNLPHALAHHQPSFDFNGGDELMFKDEGSDAAVHIESITYECDGTVPIVIYTWNVPFRVQFRE